MTRFNCMGGVKNLHDCSMSGTDITVLVGHGLFLMIRGIFVAAPLSTFLLLDTLCRHSGAGNPIAERYSLLGLHHRFGLQCLFFPATA